MNRLSLLGGKVGKNFSLIVLWATAGKLNSLSLLYISIWNNQTLAVVAVWLYWESCLDRPYRIAQCITIKNSVLVLKIKQQNLLIGCLLHPVIILLRNLRWFSNNLEIINRVKISVTDNDELVSDIKNIYAVDLLPSIITLPLPGSALKMAATQYKLLGEALVSFYP